MDMRVKFFKRVAAGVTLAFVLCACGCVPPKQAGDASADAAATQQDGFAVAVSHMAPGSSAAMSTPYGADSIVRAGGFYTSGLGQQCRRAIVSASGVDYRVAICHENGAWRLVEPIFETMQR